MKASIPQVTRQVVKVNNIGGTLTPSAPITLKNQVTELTSIENIADVDEIDVTNGATIIYNSSRNLYEIKPLNFNDLDGEVDIDGGTF